jgi:lysophospholipase L1-like esterase
MQIACAALLDDLIVAKPGIQIFVQSPITATNEALTTSLPAVRAALQNACVGKVGVTYVDGSTIPAHLSSDGIHPDAAGFVTYAAFVAALV